MSRWNFGFGSWAAALVCAALLHGCTTFTDTGLVAEGEGNVCGGAGDGVCRSGVCRPGDIIGTGEIGSP